MSLDNETCRYHHNRLLQLIEEIRHDMNMMDESYMYFSVRVSGRPTSDLEVKYSVGSGSYGEENVEGNDPAECLEEYKRRKGWKSTHNPLAIPYVKEENDTDV